MATGRVFRLALALAVAASVAGCGWFSDEEKLPGERIHIRDRSQQANETYPGAIPPVPEPYSNSAWTQTNGQSTHASGNLAAPTSPERAWRADAGSGDSDTAEITSAPIVVGGRVYTLDAAAHLSAFDADTGSRAWRTSLAPEGESGEQGFGGGLASDGNFIYATTGFGEVLAIDAKTGEIAWRTSAGAPFRAAPAVSGGVVLAVTRDNRALALSAETGEILWRAEGATASTGFLGGASPAISGQLAVIPFASGEVLGAQLTTGRRVWSAVLGGARRGLARASIADVTGDPVIAGRAVVAANQSGRTVAIDGQTGARGWTRSFGSTGPLWAAGLSIYMVTDGSALVRIALQNGETMWRTDLPAYEDPEDHEDPIAYSGPVLAGGRLLVTDSTGNLLSFDPETGKQGPTIRLASGSRTGAVVAGGTIYVLTDDATLEAFR